MVLLPSSSSSGLIRKNRYLICSIETKLCLRVYYNEFDVILGDMKVIILMENLCLCTNTLGSSPHSSKSSKVTGGRHSVLEIVEY